MPKPTDRKLIVFFALIIALFSSVCSASGEPITLQLKWKHQFQFAGFYMALEKGYYSEAGFDVTIKEIDIGTSAIDQLLQGSADYAVVDPGALLAYSNGAPIKVLASIFQHSPLALIVTNPHIRNITDLRGKRIMMAPGLNSDISAALGTVGISSNDFIRQDTSFDIRDLIEGRTDAFCGYITDQPHQLKTMGIPYRVFHPKEQGIDFYGDILVTLNRTIESEHERAIAFTEASLKGWSYALTHIDETIDIILEKYNSQNMAYRQLHFEAEKTKEMILGDVVDIGYMSDQRWKLIADTYKEQGLLPEKFNVSGFVYSHETGILDIVSQYRWQTGMIALLFFILILAMYNIRLRFAVRKRTRDLDALNLELEHLSYRDGLTGITNRRMFDETLTKEWNRALRNRYPLSLVMIDIDFFKQYNDFYGHQQGDACLKLVAKVLKGACRRAEDLVVRYGGEEFVLLLPGMDPDQTVHLAEQCRKGVVELNLPHQDSQASPVVTISLGVSTVVPSVDMDAESLLASADRFLYQAKENGRNQVVDKKGPLKRPGSSDQAIHI